MTTDGFLKIDGTFLKTQAIKESIFDESNFPQSLKELNIFLKRPKEATSSSVPSPKLNSYNGLKIGSSTTDVKYKQSAGVVAERPQLNNLAGYYFPLGSDIKGSSLEDIRSNLSKPVDKIETILNDFEKDSGVEYKKDPLFIYGEGITPYLNNINNLKTTSSIKSAWSNATVSSLTNNPISSQDGLIINPTNMTLDTEGTYNITPTISGYYCFSFYARLAGRNYNSLNNVRYLKININPEINDSYIISEDMEAKENSYSLATLKFEWQRYAVVYYLSEGITYTITLNWFYKDTTISTYSNNFRASSLKIAGVLLEKNKWPSPYEVRDSNISGDTSVLNTIYHLAVFDLDKLNNAISQNKGWIISYKRKITDTSSSNTPHYDSLGDLYWGYSGDQITANNFNEEDIPLVSADDFYLKWEWVTLRHKEDTNEIDVYVEATNSNKKYNFKINIEGLNLRKKFKGQEYNLMLGCKGEDISIISNTTYKDLFYVLDGEDVSLQKVKNNTMGIFTSEIDIVTDDKKTTEQAIVLTNMNIFEKANLEY